VLLLSSAQALYTSVSRINPTMSNITLADLQSILKQQTTDLKAQQAQQTTDLKAQQAQQTTDLKAQQAQHTTDLKTFINEALGGITTRVEAVESSVTVLQTEIAAIQGQVDQLKGKSMSSAVSLDVLPSLLAAERVAFAKVLVIKGALIKQASDLDKFAADLFSALDVCNVKVQSLSFMGKPREGISRLIRLEVEDASQALLILKSKRKLGANTAWSNVFINQMRSKMAGRLEHRMNLFYRTNIESVKMKKFHDGILLENGTRIPLHQFGADDIRVGNQVYTIPNNIPPQQQAPSCTQDCGSSSIPQASSSTNSTNRRKTRNSTKAVIQANPIKSADGTKAKKPRRDSPYSRGRSLPRINKNRPDNNNHDLGIMDVDNQLSDSVGILAASSGVASHLGGATL
jgi:hypothetical protein